MRAFNGYRLLLPGWARIFRTIGKLFAFTLFYGGLVVWSPLFVAPGTVPQSQVPPEATAVSP